MRKLRQRSYISTKASFFVLHPSKEPQQTSTLAPQETIVENEFSYTCYGYECAKSGLLAYEMRKSVHVRVRQVA